MADLPLLHHAHVAADPARERARLWCVQTLFAAAQGAATIGLMWLAVVLGGGAGDVALVIATGLAALALGTAPAAWSARRARRRPLLWGAQGLAGVALVAGLALVPTLGVAALVAAAAGLGLARASFDGAATDVLHQLVAPERQHDACRDLTARFGAGQALGLGAALVVGLQAGPHGAVLAGAVLAAAGAVVAARHHPDLDLRIAERAPLHRALRTGARHAAGDRLLGRTLAAGAVVVGLGGAQAAVLIVWLRDVVGLRGALVPALLVGLVSLRLARPALARLAAHARPAAVVTLALGVQAAAALAAYGADGWMGGAAAYALGLGAAALVGTLVNRVRRDATPGDLAPAVGLAAGAAWALAAATGALSGALLAGGLGLAVTHLVLAALALAAAAGAGAPAAARRLRAAPAGR